MKPYYHIPLTFIILLSLLLSGCLVQTTTPQYIKFDINPQTIQNANYDRYTRNYTITAQLNNNSLINYRNPIFQFTITPHIENIVDKDDYNYLFFNVSNYDKRLFRDADGVYQIIWTDHDSNIWHVSGENRYTMEDTITLTLELKLNPYQLIQISSSSLTINFHNRDNSWSESYHVKLIGIDI